MCEELENIKCEKIRGIIYCYTCKTTGKKYIGQTTNEDVRKLQFKRKSNYCKGGTSAIDNARKKYGVDDFEYCVLEEYYFDSKEQATLKLDEREMYYIEKYDTYIHGYNSTTGGHSYRAKRSEEWKSKICGKNHWNYGKKYNCGPKSKLNKKISVYDKSGNLLETCNSQKEAAEKYNVAATNIAKVCRGKLNTTGGYIFKYA